MNPFNPVYGTGQNLTAAAASASVSLKKGLRQIRIINTGSNPGQVRIGQGAQTATTADLHLIPGAIETFTISGDDDTLAYISASGTTFNVILGLGL